MGKAKLAPQTLIHTEWFHGDCLAEYYQVSPLSEEHWRIMGKFIHAAAQRHGINMLLTPVFAPPLDTAVGSERPTVQLVKITVQDGKYTFDFSLLERWTKLCREAGIEYLEIAHLFTQWGARATPKIMATVDGAEKRIFVWDVPADSPAYRSFLEQFISALQLCLPLGRSVSGLSGQGWRAAVVHPGRGTERGSCGSACIPDAGETSGPGSGAADDRPECGNGEDDLQKYPTDASYLLELRREVFEALEKI